jgi:uncharacterized membrane protein YcaP (DUF421 family)
VEPMLFWDSWLSMLRIGLIGVLGFAWLLFLVRVLGSRTLGNMTTFDFLLTVTLGSAFGRMLTAPDVAVADMVVAFSVLIGLQWGLAVLRLRSRRVAGAIDAPPTLVFHDGRPVAAAIKRHRLEESDLLGAARQQGIGSLDQVRAIVLEPGGTFSVITGSKAGDGGTFRALA